jgi:threonine/homoserine/homoserine lactone efflux protein
MYPSIFFQGIGTGFMIAALIGPIGLLCIKTTLSQGQPAGLAVGFGASLADIVFATIAAFGLSFISSFLLAHQVFLRFFGGSFLIILGTRIILEKVEIEAAKIDGKRIINIVLGTFFLTLSNPLIILSFMAVFAGLGLTDENTNYLAASLLVAGVFVGSIAWWIFLTSFLRIFHTKVNQKTIALINKYSGILIAGCGLLIMISLLIK